MPFFGPTMENRNAVFQRLKPTCVALSQTTLALNGPRGNVPELVDRLETLQQVLSTPSPAATCLDEKLADYIFFPLSQVLKLSQRVSLRCLEITIDILATLIEDGWKQRVQPQLASQILILCTLLASEKPTGLASTQTTVELRAGALRCLRSLFTALLGSANGRALFEGERNVPQAGQTLTTILDALEQSDDFSVQLEAVKTLQKMIECVGDVELIASFLPGLVSKLARVLIPKTKQRRQHEVLISCLSILGNLLSTVLGNRRKEHAAVEEAETSKVKPSVVDEKYLEAAAKQTKAALTGVFRLADHERSDVRLALVQFCLILLTKCNQVLANSAFSALETIVSVSTSSAESRSQLQNAISSHANLASLLQDVLHHLLQSLSRTMQSADERAKVQKLDQIRIAYELLSCEGNNSVLLEHEISDALRDSVIITIQMPINSASAVSQVEPVQALDLQLLDGQSSSTSFATALVRHRGQEEVLKHVERFVTYLSQSTMSSTFANDIARSLQSSQGDAQAAQLWLLYVATNAQSQRNAGTDSLLDLGHNRDSVDVPGLEELYSVSLSILSDSSDQPSDNRMKSLALRGLALQAQSTGGEFRYELIDALYPVLHTLATPDQSLQGDSITALNIITRACGYASTQDMIVSNVDYLTNAVALKLNAFDVSPQAPQVLLMMVRLAGPSLLPCLEDTVDSIFAALEDFHGYPLLVELLFKVLRVMAEEGVKAPQLAIAASADEQTVNPFEERSEPMHTTDLFKAVQERVDEERVINGTSQRDTSSNPAFPREPWSKDKTSTSDKNVKSEEDDAKAKHDQQTAEAEVPPPAPRTYALLLKITDLTQHFLPSASPSLRTSLLSLIQTTVPALAQHENSFLPLINTLWPEITARLDDEEAHVRVTALEIIAVFCEHGKDFMRSRIINLWPVLVEIYKDTVKDITLAVNSGRTKSDSAKSGGTMSKALVPNMPKLKRSLALMQDTPADYSDTSKKVLWNALVNAVTTAVACASLPPELFDEALQMVEPVLEPRIAAKFEKENADAVWLAKIRSGQLEIVGKPFVPEGRVWQWAAVPG